VSLRLSWPTEGVALLTLALPPVNALDAAAYRGLADHLDALASDPALRALVLTAEGERAFSAGTHTDAFASDSQYVEVCAACWRFFATFSRFPVPVVGALNGPAVGGGAMIAADCDVLLAAPNVYFVVPELSLGVPGGGSHVRRLAPYFKVQRMVLLGERLTLDEAVAAGTVAQVVERDGLVEAAVTVAGTIAGRDARAVHEARAIFRAPESASVRHGFRAELDAASAIVRSRTVES
jgi:enoyl-CoA hydratase